MNFSMENLVEEIEPYLKGVLNLNRNKVYINFQLVSGNKDDIYNDAYLIKIYILALGYFLNQTLEESTINITINIDKNILINYEFIHESSIGFSDLEKKASCYSINQKSSENSFSSKHFSFYIALKIAKKLNSKINYEYNSTSKKMNLSANILESSSKPLSA